MRPLAWSASLRTLIAHGWTQKQIAERVGCGRASVSRWVRGLSEPEYGNHDALRLLFEENAALLNADKVDEVNGSAAMQVLIDSKSAVVAMSPSMRDAMKKLGIASWDTVATDDGLLRLITIHRIKLPKPKK
jgi:transcriptional regulator with XRE-family HTH domain